jgi:N-formylglutamate amidohydrolase
MYPPWLVLHVPHDSLVVPDSVRSQFLLDDSELKVELDRMTDHHTLALFADQTSEAQVVRAPVSRLVVDVERFARDEDEPMAARGMGAVYSLTCHLLPLRRPLVAEERGKLMQDYYHPHHAHLERAVDRTLERHGRCLVLDCHSFPSKALPYELADPASTRPEICIGSDDFHTSLLLAGAFASAFERAGSIVKLNDPFRGALVPNSRFRSDKRVAAVMVEVNRQLYMYEPTGERLPDFNRVVQKIRRCCGSAIAACASLQT